MYICTCTLVEYRMIEFIYITLCPFRIIKQFSNCRHLVTLPQDLGPLEFRHPYNSSHRPLCIWVALKIVARFQSRRNERRYSAPWRRHKLSGSEVSNGKSQRRTRFDRSKDNSHVTNVICGLLYFTLSETFEGKRDLELFSFKTTAEGPKGKMYLIIRSLHLIASLTFDWLRRNEVFFRCLWISRFSPATTSNYRLFWPWRENLKYDTSVTNVS